MYLWDGQENLMMSEYLKNPPSIRSVYKEYYCPEPCQDIYKIFLSNIDIGRFSLSTRGIIMKPYGDRGDLNPQEKRYNVALSKSRVVVENAFGRLKGRFQCLSKCLDNSVQKTVSIVAACCTLHSVCELRKQEFFEDWLQNIDIDLGENINIPRNLSWFWAGPSTAGGNKEFD